MSKGCLSVFSSGAGQLTTVLFLRRVFHWKKFGMLVRDGTLFLQVKRSPVPEAVSWLAFVFLGEDGTCLPALPS